MVKPRKDQVQRDHEEEEVATEEEEEEEEEEIDYEIDEYNSDEDSDTFSEQEEQHASTVQREQSANLPKGPVGNRFRPSRPGYGPPNDNGVGDSHYSMLIVAIILGGIMVGVVPLYFYDPYSSSATPEAASHSSSSSSASSKASSIITPVCQLPAGEKLYSSSELAAYTQPPKILLAFLGVVYDVTSGGSYYQPPDGAYSFFAGKDATRGFLTGEFTADQLVDDISDLEEGALSGLDTWINLYEEKYQRVGRLAGGAFYDAGGCPTPKAKLVMEKIARGKVAATDSANLERQHPPCNSQWDATSKSGRVWCSTASGGISRPWTGRPRQLYVLESKSWRCACLKEDEDVPAEEWCDHQQQTSKGPKVVKIPPSTGVKYASGEGEKEGVHCLWKHYNGCDAQAVECPIAD